MTHPDSRRAFLRACTTGLFAATAGCLDASPQRSDDSPAPEPSDTDDPNATVGPATISGEAAKERALAAEEAHLESVLRNASCLDSWGTAATTASERATVVERTTEGVRVEAVHPFSYSTERTEADGASEAVYLVTPDDERREHGSGPAPC